MSRSRRKNPIIGITKAESEKQDKRLANRRFRRITRLNLDDTPNRREHSNVWCFDKDGKIYLGGTEFEENVRRK